MCVWPTTHISQFTQRFLASHHVGRQRAPMSSPYTFRPGGALKLKGDKSRYVLQPTDGSRKKTKSSTSAKPLLEDTAADGNSSTKYATTKAEQKFEEVQRKRVCTYSYLYDSFANRRVEKHTSHIKIRLIPSMRISTRSVSTMICPRLDLDNTTSRACNPCYLSTN